MTQYAALFDRITPQLGLCPQVVLLDTLQMVAVDFFRRSEVWRETLVADVGAGAYAAELFVERIAEQKAAVVRVLALRLDGSLLESGRDFTVETAGDGATVLFGVPMDLPRTIYALTVLRPLRTAVALPDVFVEEWGDVLLSGALARLKAMSGQYVGWTDPQAASLNLQLYEEGVARARIRVARGCDGRRLFVGKTR